MTNRNDFPLDVSSRTDVGLKRTANEDSALAIVPRTGTPQAERGALFVVADGMGGPGGGAVASNLTTNEFARLYYNLPSHDSEAADRIHQALETVNEAVRRKSTEIGIRGMGTTIAGLTLLPDRTVLVFNVGDSRVYRLRGRSLKMVSRDLSIDAIREEQQRLAHQEVSGNRTSLLTAFIGQPPPLRAVVNRDKAQKRDVFLLCSDGLWSLVKDGELRKILSRYPADEATAALITLARNRGGPDNITALVIRVGQKPGRRRPWGFALLIVIAVLLLLVLAAALIFVMLGGQV